jgi:hypothetical protein
MIVFKSNTAAQAFLEMADADESIKKEQHRIDGWEFLRSRVGRIVTRNNNIIRFEREVSKLLEILHNAEFCSQQAVEQLQEEIDKSLHPRLSCRI